MFSCLAQLGRIIYVFSSGAGAAIDFLFCFQSLRASKFFLMASLDLLGCSLFFFGQTMPPCYFLSPPLQPLGLGDW